MVSRIETWLSSHMAVILVLIFAAWDAATSYAYIDGAPKQLKTVEALVHMPIWIVWAVAAVVLVFGAFIPAGKGGLWTDVAVWLRGIGLAINAGLIGAWTIEFIFADARGWVSGKNYMLLTFVALHYGYLVTRYSIREA